MPLAEKALIRKIRRAAGRSHANLVVGIGDDCALLRVPGGHELLVTTDFTLEGVHFRRNWHSPEVVGWRCLARGLSDIAAMGGEPRAIFLSLALPAKLPQRWVDRFFRGLLNLAARFKLTLAGGDTAQSPSGILADIVVLGSLPRGTAVLRSGARPGDRIFVTGALGSASAALNELYAKRKIRPQNFPRHFKPLPRLAIGRFLREKRLASAMIDLSDGLSTDLAHLCEESRVGAEIVESAIPRALIGKHRTQVALRHALHGGDDYELLFTAPPGKRVPSQIEGVPLTCIGRTLRRKRIALLKEHGVAVELEAGGWEHFR